jgi:hypothetical protein
MISFYKPNSKNTGTACSFSVNPKDGSIWSSLIKQNSWNENTKTGSFLDNKDNPQKSARIKFSQTEVAGLLETLDKNIEFSAYHSSEKQVTKIKFAPYIRDEKQVGFSYSVQKENKDNIENKQNYLIGFYFNEARLLKEFLQFSLNSIFHQQQIENIKNLKNKKNLNKTLPQEEEQEGDLW